MSGELFNGVNALVIGLQQLLSWPTPMYLLSGVAVGYVVGILPGIGGPAALALVLPAILPLTPLNGLVMLTAIAAVSAGAGDLTSILIGVPGEATAAAIVPDGHAMTRRGEGGRATGAAVTASLVGAVIGAIMMILSVPIARPLVSRIQSPELTALAVLGLGLLIPLSRAHPLKGLAAGALGLALATIGLDPSVGVPRFTFDQVTLWDGVGLLPIALGLYAVPEALDTIRGPRAVQTTEPPLSTVMAGVRETFSHIALVCRCGFLGVGVGLLPGVGASVSQWIAYAHAGRKTSGRFPFGSGAIEGVIGPAAATTATLGGAMVPTLALGIPGSVATTFLLGGLIFKGLTPGPALLLPEQQGGHLTLMFSLMWAIVLASAVASLVALTTVGWIARLANANVSRLFPIVLTMVLIATVAERHTIADLATVVLVGLLGYAMAALKWPRAPLVVGFVLGPLLERRLLLSHAVYGWAWMVRPGVLLLAAGATLFVLMASRAQRPAPPTSAAIGRGSVIFGGLLTVVGAAGLLASSKLPRAAALFPSLTFGTLLCLSAVYVYTSIRKTRALSVTEAAPATVHLVRLAWFGIFVTNALLFGLVTGAMVSALCYLHFEARHSVRETIATTIAVTIVARLLVVHILNITDDASLVSWLSR